MSRYGPMMLIVLTTLAASAGCHRQASEAPAAAPAPAETARERAEAAPAKEDVAALGPTPRDPETPSAAGAPQNRITVVYEDGAVSGLVDDLEVRAGSRKLKLHELRRFRREPKPEVELAESAPITGELTGLDEALVRVAGREHRLNTRRASLILFEAPAALAPEPGFEELARGRIIKPFFRLTPASGFRGRIRDEDANRERHPIEVADKDRLRVTFMGNQMLRVEILSADKRNVQRTFMFRGDPRGQAAFDFVPGRRGDIDNLSYVIWELEWNRDVEYVAVGRLAIDFVVRDPRHNELEAGMIRLNSFYK